MGSIVIRLCGFSLRSVRCSGMKDVCLVLTATKDNGWNYYSTTTTPEWEGQIKSLREAWHRQVAKDFALW